MCTSTTETRSDVTPGSCQGQKESAIENPLFKKYNAVNLSTLEQRVRRERKPSSARNYLAALQRLRQYLGTDTLPLQDITPRWVDGYREHLQQSGLRATTANQFVACLRAMLKEPMAATMPAQYRDAFDQTHIAQPTDPTAIDILDLQSIVDSTPLGNKILEHTRQQFLGHLTDDTLHSDGDDQWDTALQCLGEALRLRHPLRAQSLQQAQTMLHNRLDHRARLLLKKLQSAVTNRWYAIRCHNLTPLETLQLTHVTDSDSYIPSRQWRSDDSNRNDLARQRPGTLPSLLDRLLFVRVKSQQAITLKRALYPDANIYSTPGDCRPSPVSDSELRLFRVLCEMATDVAISDPDEAPALDPEQYLGQQVMITAGSFSGTVGIVDRVDPRHYRVRVTFTTLGGAIVTATVPADLIETVDL